MANEENTAVFVGCFVSPKIAGAFIDICHAEGVETYDVIKSVVNSIICGKLRIKKQVHESIVVHGD